MNSTTMTNKSHFIFALFSALLLAISGTDTSAATVPATKKVLLIGNSYTYYNNMPRMIDSLAASIGENIECTAITKGGQTLKGHLENQKLIDTLRHGGWDYVVIQEQSSNPAKTTREVISNVYPYAHTLDSLAKAGSPEAKVIFYMTWGHKKGTVRKAERSNRLMRTYSEMQARLRTSYLEMTYENNAWCAPVGMAWAKVRSEMPDLELYNTKDKHHPSPAGSYLVANVILSTILQKPFTSDFSSALNQQTARYLQQVAQNTVLTNKELLNLDSPQ